MIIYLIEKKNELTSREVQSELGLGFIYPIIPQMKVIMTGKKNRKKISEKIQLYLITAPFPKNSQSPVP